MGKSKDRTWSHLRLFLLTLVATCDLAAAAAKKFSPPVSLSANTANSVNIQPESVSSLCQNRGIAVTASDIQTLQKQRPIISSIFKGKVCHIWSDLIELPPSPSHELPHFSILCYSIPYSHHLKLPYGGHTSLWTAMHALQGARCTV